MDYAFLESKTYSFIEHKVTLDDSLWQIMTGKVEFSLLNLDKIFITSSIPSSFMPPEDQNIFQRYLFDLS